MPKRFTEMIHLPGLRRSARACLALTLFLLIGCGGGAGQAARSGPPSSQSPFAVEVQRTLLTPLASAWKAGDTAAITSLIHPLSADSDRRGLLAPASAKGFGLESLKLGTSEEGPGTDESERVRVNGSYRIRGLPHEYIFNAELVLRKSETRWLVHSIVWDLSPAWAAPGPFVRTETPAALIFHAPAFPAAELGGLAATALASISAAGNRDERYLVVAPGNSEGFSAVGGKAGAIAAVVAGYRWTDRFDVSAPVMIVNGEEYAKEDSARRKTVVLHEMTHLILARETVPYVPVWFSEGLAMFYSNDVSLEALENKHGEELSLPRLTTQFELGAHDIAGLRAPLEYAYSAAAVAYMMERFGEKRVLQLLAAYKDVDPKRVDETFRGFGAGADQLAMRDLSVEVTNELIPKHLSTSLEELDRAVKAWIKAK